MIIIENSIAKPKDFKDLKDLSRLFLIMIIN